MSFMELTPTLLRMSFILKFAMCYMYDHAGDSLYCTSASLIS